MTANKPVYLIVAISENYGIGINGNVPWKLKKEMNYFTNMTKMTKYDNVKNAVIMGRKTWECIPLKYKPLDGRLNVVLSSKQEMDFHKEAIYHISLTDAIADLNNLHPEIENIWIIGGFGVYKEAMENKICNKLFITKVQLTVYCDTFFPPIPDYYNETKDSNVPEGIQEENGVKYQFKVYELV